jgi:hypothetical protein
MKNKMQDYLMSGDEANREYGLYVMEKDSPYHEKDALLAYNFDSDTFFHVRDREKGLFIPLSELTCCKDEFGNEYRGKRTKKSCQVMWKRSSITRTLILMIE